MEFKNLPPEAQEQALGALREMLTQGFREETELVIAGKVKAAFVSLYEGKAEEAASADEKLARLLCYYMGISTMEPVRGSGTGNTNESNNYNISIKMVVNPPKPAQRNIILSDIEKSKRAITCVLNDEGGWALQTFIDGQHDSIYATSGIQEAVYAIECFMGGTDTDRLTRNKIIAEMNRRNNTHHTSG